jgi:hypothetical protein
MKTRKKTGRKLGSKVVFYTKKEDDFIRSVITNGKTNLENADVICKKLGRTVSSITQRMIKLKKEMGLARTFSHKSKMSKVEEMRSVVLPKNIALEFEASRCVLKENHIIIYFKG